MSDVMALRDREYLVHYTVMPGAICPKCGSGEVYQPMQTMDLPMTANCLNCAHNAPVSEFRE